MDRETRKFWEQRRREMLRHNRGRRTSGGIGIPVTTGLILTMALGWLVETYAPGLLAIMVTRPGGSIALVLLATILPGSLLGLLFAGVFVWMIGSQIESVAAPWQYLLIFFGSGVLGGIAASMLGGIGLGGSFAAFGLAGGYVRAMARISERSAVQWTLLILGLNVVLSGFQPTILAGMATAFLTGLGIALAVRLGER
ncbi:MAG: rhomboid family intramembrane serine protease [Thermaerobacter sp.]|nr:rhomboid family intramembrane serine protease [Thermaerobacter sp.]